MALESTKKLIKLIEDHPGDEASLVKVTKYIANGADMTASTKTGASLVDFAKDKERQFRSMNMTRKAEISNGVIQTLVNEASKQLAEQVFSTDGDNVQKMNDLMKANADAYQASRYGPLGMLGCLLKQNQVPIRLDVIRLLIENYLQMQKSLMTIDQQQQTYLSIAKSNPACPREVTGFIQRQFDHILNQIPSKNPPVDPTVVNQWIAAGANIEAVDNDGNTVLCNAVKANNMNLVKALLIAGSNKSHKNRNGLTPLQLAESASVRNTQLIAYLKNANADAELKHLIEREKFDLRFEDVDRLLKAGAQINARFNDNDTLLHLLVKNRGSAEMITKFICDLKVDALAMNTQSHRAIEICILIDQEPFDRLLAFFNLPNLDTNIFQNTNLKKTLHRFAIEQQKLAAAKVIQHELNSRLWHCMLRANNDDANNQRVMNEIKQLTICGAEINHRHKDENYSKWTALHLACKTTTPKFVAYLIKDLEADYMAQTHVGDNAICIAAEYGQLPIIEYLRSLPDMNFNVSNKEGQTPLHLAAKNNHFREVHYLVRWGADPTAQNQFNQIPLDVARANAPETKEDISRHQNVMQFLEQLVCPPVDALNRSSSQNTKPSYDLDTCELPVPVSVNDIQMNTDDALRKLGDRKDNFLTPTYTEQLYDAARNGHEQRAKDAIGKGADIRPDDKNRTPRETAIKNAEKCINQLTRERPEPNERARLEKQQRGCEAVRALIEHNAYLKLWDAIKNSDANLVVGYHRAGAPLTADMIKLTCSESNDNVQILHYLATSSRDMYQTTIFDLSPNNPYKIAKMKDNNQLAAYIKYDLSCECKKAVQENNLEKVKLLVTLGASVDMQDTNNLNEALNHGNIEMIRFLFENGAKIPSQWLQMESIIFKPDTIQKFRSEDIWRVINRCLIHRRLRFSAASGDLTSLVKCQRLGADIDSKNCYGSTPVLCSLQHGNYFQIVHALLSRRASMLHSNPKESPSLIDIAETKSYNQIARYLRNALNTAFLSAIIDNDKQSAQKYGELGADFKYQDEQRRTALHHAVKYHNTELVEWLCERGSDPLIADGYGDYPIFLAVEKGDYSTVRYFVKKYPNMKTLTNKDDKTPLQLALERRFQRIARLIESGQDQPDDTLNQEEDTRAKQEYRNKLEEACRSGRIEIIQEFINKPYEPVEEKYELCGDLMIIATRAGSLQIFDLLKEHHRMLKEKLRGSSNTEPLRYVMLTERYKKILNACLTAFSELLTNSKVPMDPTDPNSYVKFFSSMIGDTEKRSQDLQRANNETDIKKLLDNYDNELANKVKSVEEQLDKIKQEQENAQENILDLEQKLSKESGLRASERKQRMKDREELKKCKAQCEETIGVLQRQQEATLRKQKIVKFINGNLNLGVFYQTIEIRLQLLFDKILENQHGYSKSTATKYQVNEAVSSMSAVLGPVLSRLKKKAQNKDFYDIATYGNIGELHLIASDTAALITLYYREQIEMVNLTKKIRVGAVFNDKIGWLKGLFHSVTEIAEEKIITFMGDYMIGWIIDGLTTGKHHIVSTESLSQQLVLHVAKTDLVNQQYSAKSSSILNSTAGKQPIDIKFKRSELDSVEVTDQVELQKLFGYVSLYDGMKHVYQYSFAHSHASSQPSMDDFKKYGFVCVQVFSSDLKALETIVEGRKLVPAKQGIYGNLLTKFEDIVKYASAIVDTHSQADSQSTMIMETADRVAEIIREQKIFPDEKHLNEKLREAQEMMEVNVDSLREKFDEKAAYYQTSIDAAHEQIEKESETNRQVMKQDNDERYKQLKKQLETQFQQMENRFRELIEKRFDEMNNDMQQKIRQISEVATSAERQSSEAQQRADRAIEISQQSLQQAKQATESSQHSQRVIEQQREELKSLGTALKDEIRKLEAEQHRSFQSKILELDGQVQQIAKQTREVIQDAHNRVKEAEEKVKESLSAVKRVKELNKEQVDLLKQQNEEVHKEAKVTREQTEKAADAARKAEKRVKEIADSLGKSSRD